MELAVAKLRAPLTGLMGYLAMLSQGDFGKLSDEQKKVVSGLLEEMQRLIRFENALLHLGKLRKGSNTKDSSDTGKPLAKITHFEDDTFLAGMYGTKFGMLGFEYAHHVNPSKDPVSVVIKDKPDLIIMDIIMPVMDGFTATQLLKGDDRTKNIPILGLCNLGQQVDIQKAHDVGMVDYLVTAKHTPQELIDRVKDILKLSKPNWIERLVS